MSDKWEDLERYIEVAIDTVERLKRDTTTEGDRWFFKDDGRISAYKQILKHMKDVDQVKKE